METDRGPAALPAESIQPRPTLHLPGHLPRRHGLQWVLRSRAGQRIQRGHSSTLINQIAANAGQVLVEAQPFAPNSNSDNAPFFIDRYELERAGRIVAATTYAMSRLWTRHPQ